MYITTHSPPDSLPAIAARIAVRVARRKHEQEAIMHTGLVYDAETVCMADQTTPIEKTGGLHAIITQPH